MRKNFKIHKICKITNIVELTEKETHIECIDENYLCNIVKDKNTRGLHMPG